MDSGLEGGEGGEYRGLVVWNFTTTGCVGGTPCSPCLNISWFIILDLVYCIQVILTTLFHLHAIINVPNKYTVYWTRFEQHSKKKGFATISLGLIYHSMVLSQPPSCETVPLMCCYTPETYLSNIARWNKYASGEETQVNTTTLKFGTIFTLIFYTRNIHSFYR
jgi:hypothetical protein